jgi:hypothetical protein
MTGTIPTDVGLLTALTKLGVWTARCQTVTNEQCGGVRDGGGVGLRVNANMWITTNVVGTIRTQVGLLRSVTML